MIATPHIANRPRRRSLARRIGRQLAASRDNTHPRLRLMQFLSRLLPVPMFSTVRASLLRGAGAMVGPSTSIAGTIRVHGEYLSCKRLVIGAFVNVSARCSIDVSADVRIGDGASLGDEVAIITADHELGPSEGRCGLVAPKPVTIGRGAWIGSRATILPGVTVGAGSVVCAGSTVYHDVPPDTMVAGTPARAVRNLASPATGDAARRNGAAVRTTTPPR